MPVYRLNIIDSDGRLLSGKNIDCADESEALARATEMSDGHEIELWDYKRFVARLPAITAKGNK